MAISPAPLMKVISGITGGALLSVAAIPGSAAAEGPDIVAEVAAHYRSTRGLPAGAPGSPGSLRRLASLGGRIGALEAQPEDCLAAAELRLLGEGADRAFLAARAAWRFLDGNRGAMARPDGEQAKLLYNLACSVCATEADWTKPEWRASGVRVDLDRNGFWTERLEMIAPACLQDSPGFGKRVVTGDLGGPLVVSVPRTKERDADWPYLPPT